MPCNSRKHSFGYEGFETRISSQSSARTKSTGANHCAGVTPLAIRFSPANFTLEGAAILGQRRSGVVEEGGGTDVPVGLRVMFFALFPC